MIYEIPNIVTSEFCDEVIEYFDKSGKRSWWQDHEDFHGRTLSPKDIDDNPELVLKIKVFQQKAVQIASKLFYNEKFIYSEFMDIVYWGPGMSMKPHIDNGYSDDDPLRSRYYSSICYLNDSYDGGHTIFPNQNKACIPEKGKMVIFPSSIEHGVSEVKDGSRYTLATWFTIFEDCVFDF